MVGRRFWCMAAAVAVLSAVAAWGRDDAAAAARRDAAWAAGKNVSFAGSDLIGKIGYDAEAKVLRVQMVHSSDWYLYRDVPSEVAEAFYRSRSKGGYFGAHVKGRYEFERQE